MLTEEQSKIVKLVYNRFIESEDESSWGELDNTLEYVGWLGDPELVTESKVRFEEHHVGVFRCAQDHGSNGQSGCFAPVILEAVGYILSLYDKTKYLPPKNKYILQYYLALTEMKLIFANAASGAV